MLLKSNIGTEFWGAAALYWVETRNHLPHSSINNEIPIAKHTGQKPDVSWFRPFGSRATVFRGKGHVNHHKISPRGEPGVFIGLGSSFGSKAWLVFCPAHNRIFASRNVVFDETLFPLREHDQRIYGKYDYAVVEEMRASKHVTTLDQEPLMKASLLWPLEAIEALQCESAAQDLSPKPAVNDN